jgi:chromosome segregation ATPase
MPSSPTNVQQQLQQKRTDLKTLESQLGDLQSRATALRTDIQSLGTIAAEYDHTVSTYGTQVAATQAAKKAADDKIAALVVTNSAKIKDKKDDIDKAIAAQEKVLTDQANAADKARKATDDAQTAATQAAAASKTAEDTLRSLKNAIPSSTASLANVNALLKQVDAAVATGNDAGAYFLLNEVQKITIALPSAEDLQKQLADAQDKSIAAKADLATKQAAAAAAKTLSDKATSDLAAAVSNRQATIVAALKLVNVAAPAPAVPVPVPAPVPPAEQQPSA